MISAFENLAQFLAQVFHRKWFLEEVNALVQHAVVRDDNAPNPKVFPRPAKNHASMKTPRISIFTIPV
jgi:hypothetical protein